MLKENLKSKSVGANCIRPHFEGITKNHNGITLIALIITIIVMMILVAVSVTVALDGGLFGTAKKAASETELKAEEEMLLSAVVGAIGTDAKVDFNKIQLPDGFTGKNGTYTSSKGNTFVVSENGEITELKIGTGVTLVPYEELTGDLKTAMDEGKITAVLKEIKDGVEYQAVIPVGFKVSTKSGENTISGGLVIFDKDGNEFVWVPCTTDASNTSGLTLYAQDTKYNDGTAELNQWSYINYSDWKDEGGNSESVSKYGGFYVGRYEAGIPNNAPFYANTDGANYITEGRNTTAYIPVSKSNNPCWNWISQVNAKKVSENMYSSSKSVESRLIDTYAWDTIVNWMESEKTGIALNSISYGNYIDSNISLIDGLYAIHVYDYTIGEWRNYSTEYKKGTIEIPVRSKVGETTFYEIATGNTEKTKILNIYDMSGNMWEWTTEIGNHNVEKSLEQYAVLRGGCFSDYGAKNPICYHNGNYTIDSSDCYFGFRVVLYVK